MDHMQTNDRSKGDPKFSSLSRDMIEPGTNKSSPLSISIKFCLACPAQNILGYLKKPALIQWP